MKKEEEYFQKTILFWRSKSVSSRKGSHGQNFSRKSADASLQTNTSLNIISMAISCRHYFLARIFLQKIFTSENLFAKVCSLSMVLSSHRPRLLHLCVCQRKEIFLSYSFDKKGYNFPSNKVWETVELSLHFQNKKKQSI